MNLDDLRAPPDVLAADRASPAPFQDLLGAARTSAAVTAWCALAALCWANSPWAGAYFRLWEHSVGIGFGDTSLVRSIHRWIVDGLMPLLFLLAGLELKRELTGSGTSAQHRPLLTLAAAAAGMLCSVGIYFAFNAGHAGAGGWAIPAATDAVAVVGILTLHRTDADPPVPGFLIGLALVSELGAAALSATLVRGDVAWEAPLLAAGLLILAAALGVAGVRRPAPYAALGIAAWALTAASGVPPVVVGAALALTIPARVRVNDDEFIARAEQAVYDFEVASDGLASGQYTNRSQQHALTALRSAVERAESPAHRMTHALRRPVLLVVLPLFVLANAGVRLDAGFLATFSPRIALGVLAALLSGKLVGILAATTVVERLGLRARPARMPWRALAGAGWAAGAGFGVALLVAVLSFDPSVELDSAKVGIIAATVLAALGRWSLASARPGVRRLTARRAFAPRIAHVGGLAVVRRGRRR